MRLRLERYSYRFAEQVLNSKLVIKQEIESTLTDPGIKLETLSRPNFNAVLREQLVAKGWQDQPHVFDENADPAARMDFLKERVGVEVGFGHASFLGIVLLKFQVSSYSSLDRINAGIYVVTSKKFQWTISKEYGQNWERSLRFEKVTQYLPHFKSAMQMPSYVLGIDL